MLNKLRKSTVNYFTNKAVWISNLKTLAVVAIVMIGFSQYQQRNMTKGEAPQLVLNYQDDNSQEFNNGTAIDYSKGPTLIYFWGSWCPVCKTTSPSVSTLAEEGNYQIVSVALSSGSNADIQTYQNEHNYHFKTINDNDGSISKQWGVEVTPSIFYINTDGQISAISTGMTSLWGMRFKLDWSWILKSNS